MKKRNILISCSTRRSAGAFLGISLVAAALPISALAENECARDPNRMNMAVQLTRSGEQKITRVAYEGLRRSLNGLLTLIPPNPPEFGSNPKDCKRDRARTLSDKEFHDACFGFLPEAAWWGDKIPNASWSRLEPVMMKMQNIELKNVALSKNPEISCKNNVCEIKTSVDQINLGFDISVRSVNDTCTQAALNGAKVSLNSANSNPVMIKAKLRLTNDVSNPVQLLWDESEFSVPTSRISFEPGSTSGNKSAVFCKNLENVQKVVPALVTDFVAKNQLVMNSIMDTVKKQVLQSMVTAQMVELGRANGVGKETYTNFPVPRLKDLMDSASLKKAVEDQFVAADNYIDSIDSAAGNTAVISERLSQNVPVALISEFRRSFKRANAKDVVEQSQPLHHKWVSIYREFLKRSNAAYDPKMKAIYDGELSKIKWTLKNLEEFQKDIQAGQTGQISDDPADVSQQVALILTALQANDLQSEIQAKVSACYRCQNLGIKATAGADWGFDSGNHDLAIKTGYGTINQFLSLMSQNNGLDTCVIENAKRDCNDARPEDGIIDVHFSNAPEIVWNPDTNSFAVKVKGIRLANHNGSLGRIARNMEADVILPGKLTIDHVTQQFHFEPIANGIHVSYPNFKAPTWIHGGLEFALKPFEGVVAWAAEKMINKAFAQDMIKDALTVNVDLPKTSTITQLKTDAQGISIYMKLPDNPLDLLPAESADRTLATSKTKLN